MSDTDSMFGRLLLSQAHDAVKTQFPNINLRKDAWVYNLGHGAWEFHGPDEYYWHGRAANAYEARYKGWMTWLEHHPKKSFLICPVRGVDPATTQGYVTQLEADGFKVHWPPRDTNQNDDTGLRICRDNMGAIKAADVVHVVWDGKSQGCLFDLGMAFALGKTVAPLSLPDASDGKSFQNMIRALAKA